MFKFLVTIALLIGILETRGQTCVVKSFRWEDPRDVKDMPMPMVDLSGKKCAVIKVETRQKGFEFDFGTMGNAIATFENDGEIWLWVPDGAQNVTIKNKQSRLSCNYPFSTKLMAQSVYVMVLDFDTVKSQNEAGIETEWINIFSWDLNTGIFIDDYPAGKTSYYGSLTRGAHKIRIEKDGQKSEKTIEIKNGGPITFQMTFRQDYNPVFNEEERGFGHPEQNPEFPGGWESMLKFIKDNFNYPVLAQQSGIEGTVFVQFLVYKTGRIKLIQVLRGIGGGCDEEAVRIIRMMPDWIPAYSHGIAYPNIFQIPIKFQLSKKK